MADNYQHLNLDLGLPTADQMELRIRLPMSSDPDVVNKVFDKASALRDEIVNEIEKPTT